MRKWGLIICEPVFERLYECVLRGYEVNELIRNKDFDVLKEKNED
ncbi:hypothetical protein SAMN05660742_105144 [Propionispira arboris]|uniref:Uncharacterized protein n=1 Tax=Propionispira arboris TaxID=84035 RepID=A0A1H6XIL5_9FIRM|nr:hypothetical protein SAMN05660742_105144 [Propionispira arboris]